MVSFSLSNVWNFPLPLTKMDEGLLSPSLWWWEINFAMPLTPSQSKMTTVCSDRSKSYRAKCGSVSSGVRTTKDPKVPSARWKPVRNFNFCISKIFTTDNHCKIILAFYLCGSARNAFQHFRPWTCTWTWFQGRWDTASHKARHPCKASPSDGDHASASSCYPPLTHFPHRLRPRLQDRPGKFASFNCLLTSASLWSVRFAHWLGFFVLFATREGNGTENGN